MRRWLPWLAVPAIVSAFLLAGRATGPELLQDTDTRVLLAKISERGAPLSWFVSDWPLENHFYRPVSTLFFEMDAKLYGSHSAGYGLTNALLAVALVWASFWLFRELTSVPWVAGASVGLLGLWMLGTGLPEVLSSGARWLGFVVWIGLLRGGLRKLGAVALASGGLFFLSWSLPALAPLGGRILGWLPGRTASVMAVFLVLGLAAMARWVRLFAKPLPDPTPDSMTVPATKGTEVVPRVGLHGWMWWPLAGLGFLLALGSYEQAVVLPGLVVVLTVAFATARRRWAGWGWLGLSMSALALYVLVRVMVVPSDPSSYQAQQFRTGPGVWLSLFDYSLPGLTGVIGFSAFLEAGASAFFISDFWSRIGLGFGTVAVAVLLLGRLGRPYGVWPWLAALVAYLPMAWLKYFEHYHLLPAVFRAWAVVTIGAVALRAVAIAVSPPALVAPPRSDPAPGSLPRP